MNQIDEVNVMNETNIQMVTIDEVAAAFERLLDKIERSGYDLKYGQVVYFAQIDILDILAGKWDDEPADEIDEPAEMGGESGWGVF